MVLKMERWYCSRSIPSIMSKTEASPLSTHPFLSQRTPKFKKMRSDIPVLEFTIEYRCTVERHVCAPTRYNLFEFPDARAGLESNPKSQQVREPTTGHRCDHAVTHTYHISYTGKYDDDRYKHAGSQRKRDGKWCCSTQRCWWDAPPFDNKNGTSTWLRRRHVTTKDDDERDL